MEMNSNIFDSIYINIYRCMCIYIYIYIYYTDTHAYISI